MHTVRVAICELPDGLIAVLRAAGSSLQRWRTAAAMVAIVSGCYVLNSNRVGGEFGGSGFAYAPGGEPIAETWRADAVVAVDVDPARVAAAQAEYPCDVRELAAPVTAARGAPSPRRSRPPR